MLSTPALAQSSLLWDNAHGIVTVLLPSDKLLLCCGPRVGVTVGVSVPGVDLWDPGHAELITVSIFHAVVKSHSEPAHRFSITSETQNPLAGSFKVVCMGRVYHSEP